MSSSKAAARPARSAAWAGPAAFLIFAWAVLLAWQTFTRLGWDPRAFAALDLNRFAPWRLGVFAWHLLSTLKNGLLLAGFALGAYGWGAVLLERVFPGGRSRLDSALYALGLGFAGWSLLLFALGAVGGLRPAVFAVIYAAAAGTGAWLAWRRRDRLRPARGWFWGAPRGAEDRLLMILATGLGLLALAATSVPEIFFDALVYHLAVPQQWIFAGGLRRLPFNFFSNLPMAVEILYAGALLLSDETLCRMLHATLAAGAVLGVFSLGRRWFGRRAGRWAAMIFAAVPLVVINGLEAGVDVGSAFFALLGFNALLAWAAAREGGERQPVLAGLLMGAGLAAKYNAAFLLAPGGLAALAAGFWSGRDLRDLIRAGVRTAGAALLPLAPWLAKNWWFTGNPFYPFLFKLFPSPWIHPEKMQQQMDGFREFGSRSFGQWLRSPWDLTFYFPTGNSFLGPVFLFLAPGWLGLAAGWRSLRPVERALLLTAAGGLLIWTSQTQIARYLIPVLPVLAVLGGAVLARLAQAGAAPGRLGRWATAAFLAFNLSAAAAITLSAWDFAGAALGLETRDAYLDRTLMNTYAPLARAAAALPPRARILAFGETRSFYFPRPVTAPTVYDRNLLIELLDQTPSAEAAWQWLRREGYTHLYIAEQEAVRTRGYEPHRWTASAVARYQELLARFAAPLASYRDQTLYRLAEVPDLARPVKAGRPLFAYDREVVPKVQEHYRLLSEAMMRNAESDAVAEAMRMIQLAPGWDVPYRQLGFLHLRAGRNEEAFAAYRRADDLAVLDAGSYNNLGVGYLQHGLRDDARRCFAAALSLDPEMVQARRNLEGLGAAPAGARP